MEQKTHDILQELKNGKDAQTAAWLSHPDDYIDLVDDIEAQGSGGASLVSNALANLAGEDEDSDIYKFATDTYPNFLKDAVTDFSQETEYAEGSAQRKAVIYAPALPINKTTPSSNSLASCFDNCRWLTTIQEYTAEAGASAEAIASLVNMSNVTNTTYMFQSCAQLIALPEQWTFPNVIRTTNMFSGSKKLASLPSGFTGQTITQASTMFNACYSLTELPQGFSLPLAQTGQRLFSQCKSLRQLPSGSSGSSGFQLGALLSFRRLFYGCASLALTEYDAITEEPLRPLNQYFSFDMSNIDNGLSSGAYNTDNTENTMNYMFYGCDAIGDGEILNEFTISAQAVGIKFDLYLHHYGFEKLSVDSIVSIFDCLHDWLDYDLDDYDYTDRFPNAAVAAATDTPQPTIYVTSAIFAQLTAAQKAIAGDKGWDVQAHL